MSERKFKITLDEDELKAVIEHNRIAHGASGNYDNERSARIHDLTKRLNKKDSEPETTEEINTTVQNTSTVAGW